MTLHLKFRRLPYEAGPAHAQVQIFAALAPDDVPDPTVGLCGEVTMRIDEWEALEHILEEPIEDVGSSFRISKARP